MSINFHHPETLGMSISGHTWRDEVIAQINNDPTYQKKALECSEMFLATMRKKLEKAAPGYAATAVNACFSSIPRYEYIKNVGPDEECTACIDLLLHAVTFCEGGSNGADAPQLLPREDLADIFAYCAHISRLVSPRQAMTYFNFTYDGSVADTFYGLSMLYAGEGAARSADDFKRDELYGPTLQQMLKDIRETIREASEEEED